MQRKLIFIAAFIAAVVIQKEAKAQSIRVFNQCREASRIFTFERVSRYATLEYLTIGSYCPAQQMPVNRLPVGNYDFKNLPVKTGEEWTWFVDAEGETVRKGIVENGSFFTTLGEGERLTIVIAEKLVCNCPLTSIKQ